MQIDLYNKIISLEEQKMELIEVKVFLCLPFFVTKSFLESTIQIPKLLITTDLENKEIELPYISKNGENRIFRTKVDKIICEAGSERITLVLYCPLAISNKQRKEFFEYTKKENSSWTLLTKK